MAFQRRDDWTEFVMDQELKYYRAMLRIRRFEETILDQFKRGLFSGTTHTSLGQEANAVGVISQMLPDNVIVTNHRCHGHFLAYGGDMRALFAELMGRSTGICAGRGGSQHIHWRNLVFQWRPGRHRADRGGDGAG